MLIDETPKTERLVPPFLAELTEFAALYQVQDILLQDYFDALSLLYQDAFPATAARPALIRFLGFLQLPQPAAETECRTLLLGKLASHPPFNLQTVSAICQTYLGEDGSVQYFPSQSTVQVKYPSHYTQTEALRHTLRALIPAALLLIIRENYLAFNDLDAASLTWAQLDSKQATFATLPNLAI